MPFANFKMPQGLSTAAHKKEIIHKTTNMYVEYFSEDARKHAWSSSTKLSMEDGAEPTKS